MTFFKAQNPQGGPSRRTLITGAATAGAALLAGLYRFTDLFVKHYAPTPYDDILGALVSDASAPQALATKLRATIKPSLTAAAQADAAAGRLTEVGGWVVPESVALLAALAARV